MGAFSAANIFLDDYIAEFGRSNVQFSSFFKTDKLHAPIVKLLEEIDLLDEGPVLESKLGYI